ncbi:hypothetical protein [Streptomyces sp. NPDC056255]|uniref:hypothetical protein n=1 Tax=Streptomyces sp. NPDC056255 TaxID=3345764 RepID=UPI0035D5AC83
MSSPVAANLGNLVQISGGVSGTKLDADLTLSVELDPGRRQRILLAGSLLDGIEKDLANDSFEGSAKLWAKKNEKGRYDLFGRFSLRSKLESDGGGYRRFEAEDCNLTTLALDSDPVGPQDGASTASAIVRASLMDLGDLTGTVSGTKLDADLTLSVELDPGRAQRIPLAGSLLDGFEKDLTNDAFEGNAKLWAKKNEKGRYDLFGRFSLRSKLETDGGGYRRVEIEDMNLTTLYF